MEPILVGYLVMCSGELTYVGRTSMEVRVEVVTENPLRGEPKAVLEKFEIVLTRGFEGRMQVVDDEGKPVAKAAMTT